MSVVRKAYSMMPLQPDEVYSSSLAQLEDEKEAPDCLLAGYLSDKSTV